MFCFAAIFVTGFWSHSKITVISCHLLRWTYCYKIITRINLTKISLGVCRNKSLIIFGFVSFRVRSLKCLIFTKCALYHPAGWEREPSSQWELATSLQLTNQRPAPGQTDMRTRGRARKWPHVTQTVASSNFHDAARLNHALIGQWDLYTPFDWLIVSHLGLNVWGGDSGQSEVSLHPRSWPPFIKNSWEILYLHKTEREAKDRQSVWLIRLETMHCCH